MTPEELKLWYNMAILSYIESNGAITNYVDDLDFHAFLDVDNQTITFGNWYASCPPPTYNDILAIDIQEAYCVMNVANAAGNLCCNATGLSCDDHFPYLVPFAKDGALCYNTTTCRLMMFDQGG